MKNDDVDLQWFGQGVTARGWWGKSLDQFSRDEILALIKLAVDCSGQWPPDIRRLINWLKTAELPDAPVVLRGTEEMPTTRVGSARDFQRQMLIDLEAGPMGPRAFYGVLQSDLRRLFTIFGDEIPF